MWHTLSTSYHAQRGERLTYPCSVRADRTGLPPKLRDRRTERRVRQHLDLHNPDYFKTPHGSVSSISVCLSVSHSPSLYPSVFGSLSLLLCRCVFLAGSEAIASLLITAIWSVCLRADRCFIPTRHPHNRCHLHRHLKQNHHPLARPRLRCDLLEVCLMEVSMCHNGS